MSASDYYEQAEDYFKDENYSKASEFYDKAIQLKPDNAKYLANRAANSIKLRQYESALADTQKAVSLDSQPNGRILMRQGQALFYLDRFDEALATFEQATKLGQEKTELWIRKCKAEQERIKAAATAQPIILSAPTEANKPIVHKIEALPPQPKEKETEKSSSSSSSSASSSSTPILPKAPANLADRTREQWFQTTTEVTVTLLAKNLTKDQVNITLNESSNELHAALTFPSDGSKFTRDWQLWGQVSKDHTVNITPYKVEVILQKMGEGTWDSLERKANESVAPIVKRENVMKENVNYAAYPTSSKVLKNWEEVEKTAKVLEEEEKPEGEAALQKLFQSIYSGADEDTRRAMVKSFQTSGGTVLSTNWKEVKDKNYKDEIQAPKGQEAVDWNSRTRGAL